MKALTGLFVALICLIGCGQKSSLEKCIGPMTPKAKLAAITKAPPGWSWVSYLDEKGNVLGEEWDYRPPYDRFAKYGRSQLPKYVERMLKSSSTNAFVSLFDLGESKGLSLQKMDSEVSLSFIFGPESPQEHEPKTRALAGDLGLPVTEDYKSEDGQRILGFGLPKDGKRILAIAGRFLDDVLKLPESSGLMIQFDDEVDSPNTPGGTSGFMFTYPIEDPKAPPPAKR